MEYTKSKNKYFISFILIIFFESLNVFSLNHPNQIIKFLSYLYIYISIFFIIFKIEISNFSDFSKITKFLFLIILIYGLFEIFLNIDDNWNLFASNFYISTFGNITYGPMFLAPIFFLWAINLKSLDYFEKISFLTVVIGIFINTIFIFFETKLILVLLLPTFYLLAGFNYRSNLQKIIIIISLCLSFLYFLAESYRSGAIRIILSLIPFLLIYFNFKRINTLFLFFFLFYPIFIIFTALNDYPLLFSNIQKIYLGSNYDPLYVDTRTFLYNEFFEEYKNSNLKTILFGKGALGTYYSPYFEQIYNSQVLSYRGDFYIRSISEVGIIHLLLKGGFVYFFLFFLLLFIVLIRGLKKVNNNYIKYQILNLSIFFTYMTIENRPYFSFLYICFWIILGLCSSQKILNLSDREIKNQIFKNN
jgi:hypothetical protein